MKKLLFILIVCCSFKGFGQIIDSIYAKPIHYTDIIVDATENDIECKKCKYKTVKKNGLIIAKGYFIKGLLFSGDKYFYDVKGKLIREEKYEKFILIK